MSLTASSPNASSPITLLFVWMAALFVTALLVANTIGGILVPLPLPWGQAVVTAGIFIFPITFVLTDLLNEFFGEAGAKRVTWLGFAMGLVTFVGYKVAVLVPALRQSPLPQGAFALVEAQYSDMILASMAAYLVGQFLDIALFGWFKRTTGAKLIWLRATGSTVVSQLFDSVLVVGLTFYNDLLWPELLQVAWGNYQVKLLVAVLITPLIYLGHWLIKRSRKA
jgi:uncharacterized integral membrane protein (TIGR00697 family)